MVIKHKNTNKKSVGIMKIYEYLINSNYSGALVEINGDHGMIRNLNEDRIYFIMEGRGEFIVNNVKEVVSKSDLIFVPKNTPYNIIGQLTYFMVCSPEFNAADDIVETK